MLSSVNLVEYNLHQNLMIEIYTRNFDFHITVPSPNLAFLCRNLDYKSYSIKKKSRLFNSLPANIRNTTNCETSVFKKKGDSYLQTILDNPYVPNEDNSLDARINEMRWCTLRGGMDG